MDGINTLGIMGFDNFFGSTTTTKASVSNKLVYDSHIGDKISISTYTGKVIGKSGLINQDVSTLNLKKDEYILSVGPISISYGF